MLQTPVIPIVALLLLILAAAFAPLVAPHDPLRIDLAHVQKPPFFAPGGDLSNPLGTDKLGRDVLSRIIYGGRVSISLALAVLAIGGSIGTVLGLVSGYFGGRIDGMIQRGAEAILSFPTLVIALVFVFLIGQSIASIVLILSPFIVARFARIVRGDVLTVREQPYVALAEVAGASRRRIIWRHILPNVAGTVIVVATLEVGHLILVESSLSFLGVGVPPPTPAWGLMVADGRASMASAYWVSLFPGLAILITVLSINWMGDWLRDFLDPKQQRQ